MNRVILGLLVASVALVTPAVAAPKASADPRLKGCTLKWKGALLTATCGKAVLTVSRVGDVGLDEERDGRFRRFLRQRAANAPMERESKAAGPYRVEFAIAVPKEPAGQLRALAYRDDLPAWQLDCLDPRANGLRTCTDTTLAVAEKLAKDEATKLLPPLPKVRPIGQPAMQARSHAEFSALRREVWLKGGAIDVDADGKDDTTLAVLGKARTITAAERGRTVQAVRYLNGTMVGSEEDVDGDGRFDQKFEASQAGQTRVESWQFDENLDGTYDVRRTWTTFNPGPTETCHDKLERLHQGEWTRERDKGVKCSDF